MRSRAKVVINGAFSDVDYIGALEEDDAGRAARDANEDQLSALDPLMRFKHPKKVKRGVVTGIAKS